ncbi:MAG: ABC transporter ATP-binding protein [Acidobacteriota bacterium]|jgi:ABC-2 type transport system ATP-binding protein
MQPALEVVALSKRFEGFALDEVSFTVPRGYVMGLIGPNGAGKTTTLKTILGLLRRDSGEIRVLGLDPAADGAAARARVGFVHDEPRFYRHLTLLQNAALVARFYPTWEDATFRRLLDAFELPARKRFGTLSRGMRTKFALALALAHRAELIVMDEPTTGLDPVFRRELLDLLLDLLQDERVAILFSTHITADLDRIADYVTLLQDGRVQFSTAKDDILDSWGLVKGSLDDLERLPPDLLRGVRRRAHGFEAITEDAGAVRACTGREILVERPTLEDIVLLTTAEHQDA